MAWQTKALVRDLSGTKPPGHVFTKDLTKGQKDQQVTVSNEFSADKGWWDVINFDFYAKAPVNLSTGTSTGNINETLVKLTKYVGRNSPVWLAALASRSAFEIEIRFLESTGQLPDAKADKVSSPTAHLFVFKTCILQSVRQFTGDQRTGSASTSVTAGQLTDTRELEEVSFVYQSMYSEAWIAGKMDTTAPVIISTGS
jgi:hypothetical protein